MYHLLSVCFVVALYSASWLVASVVAWHLVKVGRQGNCSVSKAQTLCSVMLTTDDAALCLRLLLTPTIRPCSQRQPPACAARPGRPERWRANLEWPSPVSLACHQTPA